MKKLIQIEALLTMLALTAVLVIAQFAEWLRAMAETDPVRQLWQSRLALPSDILWYGALFPWIGYSVFFFILTFVYGTAWTLSRLGGEDRA